ncbi:hypothetical protein GN956_G1713 [Arapaima gigas]
MLAVIVARRALARQPRPVCPLVIHTKLEMLAVTFPTSARPFPATVALVQIVFAQPNTSGCFGQTFVDLGTFLPLSMSTHGRLISAALRFAPNSVFTLELKKPACHNSFHLSPAREHRRHGPRVEVQGLSFLTIECSCELEKFLETGDGDIPARRAELI